MIKYKFSNVFSSGLLFFQKKQSNLISSVYFFNLLNLIRFKKHLSINILWYHCGKLKNYLSPCFQLQGFKIKSRSIKNGNACVTIIFNFESNHHQICYLYFVRNYSVFTWHDQNFYYMYIIDKQSCGIQNFVRPICIYIDNVTQHLSEHFNKY